MGKTLGSIGLSLARAGTQHALFGDPPPTNVACWEQDTAKSSADVRARADAR
jgi:hypothetical protein